MIKHKHHIIPKHAGGTDDPSNLVELTVEEHAEAHRRLYLTFNRNQDRLAWLALSGKITHKEASEEARLDAVRSSKRHKEASRKLCLERNEKNNPMQPGMTNSGSFQKGRTYQMSEEHRKKIASKLKNNRSTSGYFWITNGIETKYSSGVIPDGWRRGRK